MKDYFVQLLEDDNFQNLLKINATTDEGMKFVADYYVWAHWDNYLTSHERQQNQTEK